MLADIQESLTKINFCVRALDSAQYVAAGLPLSGHCHLPINSSAAGCSCSKTFVQMLNKMEKL